MRSAVVWCQVCWPQPHPGCQTGSFYLCVSVCFCTYMRCVGIPLLCSAGPFPIKHMAPIDKVLVGKHVTSNKCTKRFQNKFSNPKGTLKDCCDCTHTHTLVNMVTLLYNNVLGTVRLLSYFELRWFILLRLFYCLFKIRWWPLSLSLSFPSFFHSFKPPFSLCVFISFHPVPVFPLHPLSHTFSSHSPFLSLPIPSSFPRHCFIPWPSSLLPTLPYLEPVQYITWSHVLTLQLQCYNYHLFFSLFLSWWCVCSWHLHHPLSEAILL